LATNVRLDDKVVKAIKRLKGEPISTGVVKLTEEYIERTMGEYRKRLGELRGKYRSKRRLEEKVLRGEHTWDEETALFDWESVELELKKFGDAAKELGVR